MDPTGSPTESVPTMPKISSEAKPVRKQLPTPVLIGLAAAAFLLILFLQNWASGRAVQAAREATWKRAFNAVAAASVPTLLERKPDRAKKLVNDIAQAAGFKVVTLCAPDGTVIASTSTTETGKTISLGKTLPVTEPRAETIPGGMRYTKAAVIGGDNTVGVLIVEVADEP